jgi:hypothetical protein
MSADQLRTVRASAPPGAQQNGRFWRARFQLIGISADRGECPCLTPGVAQSWHDLGANLSAICRGTRPRDPARQVRLHPSVRPRRPAGAAQAPAAALRPRSPEARPADRDQVQRDRGDRDPLLRSYGPWGSSVHVSYPYGRLVNDGLWFLPDYGQLVDAKGNVREGVARERDAPAGFTPDVLATFEREPELIDVVALHLLERHFAPGVHDEILEAVNLELGTRSPPAIATWPFAPRCSRPTLPSAASAASRCARSMV